MKYSSCGVRSADASSREWFRWICSFNMIVALLEVSKSVGCGNNGALVKKKLLCCCFVGFTAVASPSSTLIGRRLNKSTIEHANGINLAIRTRATNKQGGRVRSNFVEDHEIVRRDGLACVAFRSGSCHRPDSSHDQHIEGLYCELSLHLHPTQTTRFHPLILTVIVAARHHFRDKLPWHNTTTVK